MFIERQIERHQLPLYLTVYNRYTDQLLGYLGNVSEAGLMVISELPILVGPDFELQLRIPLPGDGWQFINLTASCLWCQEDQMPGHYDSGFMVHQPPQAYGQLINALVQYFSFDPQQAPV